MHIIVVGDSIAEGLGVAGCSYADLLATKYFQEAQEIKVTNLAASAAQITYSAGRLSEIVDHKPDVVIIAHGTTEAIIRPIPAALRFIPPRWRQIGWLDPRPYFSRRFWKRTYQQAESSLRWRIKVWLIRQFGGHTLLSIDEFQQCLSGMVEMLLAKTDAHVILLSHNSVDERFYPGSLASLREYQRRVEQVAAQTRIPERVQVCDTSNVLKTWSDYFADHFHPNAAGHTKIAEAVYAVLPPSLKAP